MLRDAKKYLFKLNNNQRANYQFRIFKIVFIRNAINMIEKTSSITTITSIIRIILIIEASFVSTIKSKQKTIFKRFMCFNCNKIDYHKKDYIIQNQIESKKKILKKA